VVVNLAISVAFCSLLIGSSVNAADAFTMVVHPSHPKSSIDLETLKQVYMGRLSRWPSGKKVVIVLPKTGTPKSVWLSNELLKLPEQILRTLVTEAVFRGRLVAPVRASSVGDTIAAVAQTEGAIAVLPTASVTDKVKILAIKR